MGCLHENWWNGKCHDCGKILTLDEKWNATVRNVAYLKEHGKLESTRQDAEIYEAELITMGEEIVTLRRELQNLRGDKQ